MGSYDIAVIGGGPGGYVAAIRAAQLGFRTVLFEADRVGGLCLNWGCIPSKALLRNADVLTLVRNASAWGIRVDGVEADYGAAVDRSRKVVDQIVSGVEGLLRDNGVDVVSARARIAAPGVVEGGGERFEARWIVVATGGTPRQLPGVEVDGDVVITSREALARRNVPERAVIIGAGPIGVEFAHLWSTYGADVTLVELLDTVLPQEDPDVSRALRRSFEARGIRCLTSARVGAVERSPSGARVTVEHAGARTTLDADTVLVAVGFVANTAGLGLEELGVATDRGFIAIDDAMATNVPGVLAIGDVTGKLMLAHVAMQQGVAAVERLAGRSVPPLDYVQMPRATFCQPQVGSVGYTEPAARAAGFEVRTGRFPFTALGKAIAVGETEGFVKVVADAETKQVLGIHVIGHDVVDLLGEASLAVLLEVTTEELGFAVRVHPTLPEAVKEAALAVDGEAIHIARRRAQRAAATGGGSA
ncbi:Dihydrolipoyl dehydrogenase [bacterium HR29]|jgi:dihydrolipoamide dehydrogenase|nr:Dihydrolipoyl dehydrogenase [bacterium HR29]